MGEREKEEAGCKDGRRDIGYAVNMQTKAGEEGANARPTATKIEAVAQATLTDVSYGPAAMSVAFGAASADAFAASLPAPEETARELPVFDVVLASSSGCCVYRGQRRCR